MPVTVKGVGGLGPRSGVVRVKAAPPSQSCAPEFVWRCGFLVENSDIFISFFARFIGRAIG